MAIDGTKMAANAFKHKAMSYERMTETDKRLQQQVEQLLAEADRVDAQEDAQYGKGPRGDELPIELQRRESRLKKIRAAMADLQAEAKAQAEHKAAEAKAKLEERARHEALTGKKVAGKPPAVPEVEQAKPDPKAQRNLTDPDSRIMPDGANKGSFVQGYNAQIAVDGEAQIIVAAEVVQAPNDKQQLPARLEQVEPNVGLPDVTSADAGYFSEQAIEACESIGAELRVPPDRQIHGQRVVRAPLPECASTVDWMRFNLRSAHP